MAIHIAGATVDTQYRQLNVNGAVNLTGANLLLTSNFPSITGTEVFTIVSATGGVTGTFTNFPVETQVSINSIPYKILYNTNTVQLSRVNVAPTDIALSSSSIAENAAINATVGTLSTNDPDAANTFTYTLETGLGDTDNAAFSIVGNSVQAALSFDFESKSSYSIRVRSTDQGGLWFEKSFTITVLDVDDTAPTVTSTSFLATGTVDAGGSTVTVTFSEPVLNGSVLSNYQLRRAGVDGLLLGSDSVITPTSVALNGNTATLMFAPLVEDVYRLTVTDADHGFSGNQLDGDKQWVCRT